MNATVYLFGYFNSGYSQYPDDNTSEIFAKFQERAKFTTQIAIHREGSLMYYGYIRKLEGGRYIGFCVVLNSLMLTRIDVMVSLFEHTICGLVMEGQLIRFNKKGEIVANVETLYKKKEVVDLVNESLRTGFNRFRKKTKVLPAVSYGVSKDSIKEFDMDDDLAEIIKSTHTNGYTFVYFNTAQLDSYRGVLTQVNNEKKELQERLEKLQIEHGRVLRQKKQFKIVITLFVVLMWCAAGLIFLNGNLNLTRDALSSANDTISMQSKSINSQSVRILELHIENTTLRDEVSELNLRCESEQTLREKAESNLENLTSIITKRQPFIVKKTSFNFSTGYFHFDYYGMKEGYVKIIVRAYNDDGENFAVNSSIYVEPGDNSASIYLSNNLNSRKWYSFEILRDNVILGGDKH